MSRIAVPTREAAPAASIAMVAENVFTPLVDIVAGAENDFPVIRTGQAA